jgi:tetratricopeptide (TPR) repeat protein
MIAPAAITTGRWPARTFVLRAEIRKGAGDLDGASADLDRALAVLPRERAASAYHLRGGVRALRDDFRGALADYDVAIGIQPGNHCYYVSRGNARFHLRDAQALADYCVAFKLDPSATAREIATLFADDASRRPDAVLKNCAQHIRLNPADGIAYLRRALTLTFLGRRDEAESDLHQCRRLLGGAWAYARLIVQEADQRLTPPAPVSLNLGGVPSGPSRARPRPAPALRVSYSV